MKTLPDSPPDRFRRRRSTYAALAKAFADKPGNFRYAAKVARVSPATAKVAWEDGWEESWAPPIRDRYDPGQFVNDADEVRTAAARCRSFVSVEDRLEALRIGLDTEVWETHKSRKLRLAAEKAERDTDYKNDYRVAMVADVLKAYDGTADPREIQRDLAATRVLDLFAIREATLTSAAVLKQIGKTVKAVTRLRRALIARVTKLCEDPDTEPERILTLLNRVLKLQSDAVMGYRGAHELARLCLGEGPVDQPPDEMPMDMTPEEALRITHEAHEAAKRAIAWAKAEKAKKREDERAARARPVNQNDEE